MAEHAASAAGLRAERRCVGHQRPKDIGLATDGRSATASPATMNGRRYAAND
jgi:hypothetical protein